MAILFLIPLLACVLLPVYLVGLVVVMAIHRTKSEPLTYNLAAKKLLFISAGVQELK